MVILLSILLICSHLSITYAEESPQQQSEIHSQNAVEGIKNNIEKSRNTEVNISEAQKIIKAITENPNFKDATDSAADIYNKAVIDSTQSLTEVMRSFMPDTSGMKEKYYTEVPYSKNNQILNKYLEPNERLYLFISSSIPADTLSRYAQFLDEIFDERAAMILKGCVQGCKYIAPTRDFVRSFLQYGTRDNKPLLYKVNVMIDPFLFKRYNIDRVPALVFVYGLELDDESLSEGLDSNVKRSQYVTFVGDAPFITAIEKIYTYLTENNFYKAESLRRIIRYFKNKRTFTNGESND